MGLSNPFARYFQDRDESRISQDRARQINDAQEVLRWTSAPFHKVFMEWLDDQARGMIAIDDPLSATKGAVRNNTLRQVRDHVQSLERRASQTLDDAMSPEDD